MARKQKSEWQDSQREHQERTDAEERVSEEIKDDAEIARDDFNDQVEPSLTDTADALNSVAADLKSEMQAQHGEQAEKVEGAVDTQRHEVSEPAREGEATERQAGEAFDVAASRNKRFGKILADAADQRRDAEAFLREVADDDERDQEDSKETLAEHRRAVEQAVQNIQEL